MKIFDAISRNVFELEDSHLNLIYFLKDKHIPLPLMFYLVSRQFKEKQKIKFFLINCYYKKKFLLKFQSVTHSSTDCTLSAFFYPPLKSFGPSSLHKEKYFDFLKHLLFSLQTDTNIFFMDNS